MTTTTTKERTVSNLPEHEAEAARQFAAKLEAETGVSVDGVPLRDDDYTAESLDRDAEADEADEHGEAPVLTHEREAYEAEYARDDQERFTR